MKKSQGCWLLIALGAVTANAYADGCGKERALNAAEQKFVADHLAAARAAFPAPPAGWARYEPDAGLRARVAQDLPPPTTVCEQWGPRPLSLSAHATYTPADSALMRDLQKQRDEQAQQKKVAELQQKMQEAGARGDYNAMASLNQQMQAASMPAGAKAAAPMSDAEYDRQNEALSKKLEAAQARSDYTAMQQISAQQMALVMRKAGVDTSGVAAAEITSDQINAAPRVHVVVEFNRDAFDIPENAKKVSYGGAAVGYAARGDHFCYDNGGGSDREQVYLLFGPWQGKTNYNNQLANYISDAADHGAFASQVTTLVSICGDPAMVEKLAPAIRYDALRR
ncbi:MAG TPA: hypothetical protein VHE37_13040 [Nevskiaceae bacterium]|nr:hypothetical protein [Nevskiaceae bacterium]